VRTLLPFPFTGSFNFPAVVFSHGWSSLAPFFTTESPLQLQRDIRISRKSIVRAILTDNPKAHPSVIIESTSPLSAPRITSIKSGLHTMLHLDLDLHPFYERTRKQQRLSWAQDFGAGRMLRSQTFFEDVVKTILTTNCSWSLTTSMNRNLIYKLGYQNSKAFYAYPMPEIIADGSVTFLRKECKLGYRAEYIHELARNCSSGKIDIESFRHSTASEEELYAELLSIKGIGEYAAANLLRLLGKFNHLGLDSWCRNAIAKLHGNGRQLSDTETESLYAEFEEWKGLAMWLDVTRDWYFQKFPIN
jgi:3-methyladenine DNA glycosylase/8-oxoguanine DNA glycosylase